MYDSMMQREPDTKIECSCGEIFEPKKIEVDASGEEWAICPKCKAKIRLEAIYC
jgi:predicted SprT family Zn-dependent metalloprotease